MTILLEQKRPRCEFKVQCPMNCNYRGECIFGKCACNPGWKGISCETLIQCPKQCSGHGICSDGICTCSRGFEGDDCALVVNDLLPCRKNCSNRGQCYKGQCICDFGYEGFICQNKIDIFTQSCRLDAQSKVCSGDANGFCLNGTCNCYPGYTGQYCDRANIKNCKNNCTHSNQGLCMNDRCMCRTGWEGLDCSIKSICDNNCSNRGSFNENFIGDCFQGICICEEGSTGPDCSQNGVQIVPIQVQEVLDQNLALNGHDCPNSCHFLTGNGICMNQKCICNQDYSGEACEIYTTPLCPENCNNNGICHYGRCYCTPGFLGPTCKEIQRCPDDCGTNGICRYGKCFCLKGFIGDNCMIAIDEKSVDILAWKSQSQDSIQINKEMCINDCNKKGICVQGVCNCEEGLYGFDCSFSTQDRKLPCKDNCNGRGDCISGKCYCNPGYFGQTCKNQTYFMCPGDGFCSGHGKCNNGRCICDLEFIGDQCQQRYCHTTIDDKSQCSRKGFCKNDHCFCDPGFSGTVCEKIVPNTNCPNDCNGKGICENSQCICAEGYFPPQCTKNMPRFKELDENVFQQILRINQKQNRRSTQSIQILQNLRCKNGCWAKGDCVQNTCVCKNGWTGEDCSERLENIWRQNNYYQKMASSTSEKETCEILGCFNGGLCFQKRCLCVANYTGKFCQEKVHIMSKNETQCKGIKCDQNEICMNGLCFMIGNLTIMEHQKNITSQNNSNINATIPTKPKKQKNLNPFKKEQKKQKLPPKVKVQPQLGMKTIRQSLQRFYNVYMYEYEYFLTILKYSLFVVLITCFLVFAIMTFYLYYLNDQKIKITIHQIKKSNSEESQQLNQSEQKNQIKSFSPFDT